MNTRILGLTGVVVTAVVLLLAPMRPALRPSQAATEAASASQAARLAKSASVDAFDIEHQKPGQWLSYGRTYSA